MLILYSCPVCQTPMFEKDGLKLYLMQRQRGKSVKTEFDRSDTEGTLRIRCGACQKGAHIMHIHRETISIGESVTTNSEPVVREIFACG